MSLHSNMTIPAWKGPRPHTESKSGGSDTTGEWKNRYLGNLAFSAPLSLSSKIRRSNRGDRHVNHMLHYYIVSAIRRFVRVSIVSMLKSLESETH